MAKKNQKKIEEAYPQIMPGANDEERLQALKDTADEIRHEFYYFKPLTDLELVETKNDLSEITLELTRLKEDFEQIKTEFKEETKPLDNRLKSLIQTIKMKGNFVLEDVFVMKNFEEKKALFYNSKGEFIEWRPLLPEEMQKTIKLNEDKGSE